MKTDTSQNGIFKSLLWMTAILSITLIIITLIFSTAQKLKDQNRKELKQVLTGVLKSLKELCIFGLGLSICKELVLAHGGKI
ncbi:MAG: cell wall metabolism sensor histidine kinase WalK [Bacteriovoracaceae bacterium]|nr:cell wall metabolism sensor histidine kinase WalK [Bacteriovoracaceae bacterium]